MTSSIFTIKRFVFSLLLLAAGNTALCQEVIINGVNKNRLLTWDDFTGNPDRATSYGANTYWKLNYRFSGISFSGDTVRLTGLSVKLELDKERSWVKAEKESPDLLKHEQGHFNLGLICQYEVIRQLSTAVFLKSDFKTKPQTIFSEIFNQYRSLGDKYDEETSHSNNREEQEKWNNFFDKELNARSISF